MIVYQSDKTGFQAHVETGDIDNIILANYKKAFGRGVGAGEVRSWHQSLTHMSMVLGDEGIPGDTGVSIELQIPQTAKRIDVLLTGRNAEGVDHAVIVELKQWESAEPTGMDGVVRTFVGGGVREVSHPSYQAWSYASLLMDFNEAVYDGDIQLKPCAYLHNFRDTGILDADFYRKHTEQAPVFLKRDIHRLREFIKKYVVHGDGGEVIYRIENGRIRPSKMLAESMASLLEGNPEFVMIDDQKVVFETALEMARTSVGEGKQVLLVHGGPGTGKSVVAVNLLVELTKREDLALYVTKNAAPRAVFESKLTGVMTKSRFSNLFKGSGAFVTAERHIYDVLVVDEAHRLNEHSGLYKNLGENQVKELIHASRTTIFFLDEDQRVTLRDIGTAEEIRHWARQAGAQLREMTLESQFRCNGSDGYLAWLDQTLGIRPTAHSDLEGVDYEVRVCETPNELRDLIEARNEENGRSRLVAGYCWEWESKKNPEACDIVLPEHDFRMRWNLTEDGSLWILKPSSINEIGCIHTCQGLELDHVGVILGPDFLVRDGVVETHPEARARYDSSIRGWKKAMKADPERTRRETRAIILNTYRTLMSRGMRGCYLYSVDEETNDYLRGCL
jgi:uncharacterized protein